ncbi:MAG: PD40 domain-containing protein [Bacteroidetes bacterium]|nr:PD40 domain-containing protein [Bacteroidota bacterium]
MRRILLHTLSFTFMMAMFLNAQTTAMTGAKGYKVAYNVLTDKANDNYEIFIMNADGSEKKNISNWKGVDWVYTSHKNRIYFVSDRDTSHRKYFLYEMDTDGGNIRRISRFLVADSWQGVRKNGAEFVVSSPKDHRRNELYLIDKDGNELKRLTNDTLNDNDPIFSPNGETIVFRSKRGTRYDELWMMKSNGTDLRRLTYYPEEDTTAFIHSYHAGPPFWEPNRNIISYLSNQQGRSSIFVIDPDGKNQRRLTDQTEMNLGWHSWSHDGRFLAAEGSDMQNKKFSIYLLDRTGTILKQLTSEFQYEQAPVFVQIE